MRLPIFAKSLLMKTIMTITIEMVSLWPHRIEKSYKMCSTSRLKLINIRMPPNSYGIAIAITIAITITVAITIAVAITVAITNTMAFTIPIPIPIPIPVVIPITFIPILCISSHRHSI